MEVEGPQQNPPPHFSATPAATHILAIKLRILESMQRPEVGTEA
jgi:hypothetical protein